MMKIHVLRTGEVRVSPYLPFGGDNCSLLKASGMTTPKKDWIWLPVSVYLIEHPNGLLLVDTGWHRDMSPDGVYGKKAQIRSLGSFILYHVNQGRIPLGEAVSDTADSTDNKSTPKTVARLTDKSEDGKDTFAVLDV